MSIVSLSAVEAFVLRSDIIDRSKRLSCKSGKKDVESPWAKARLQQFLQFQYQLEYGDVLEQGIPFCAPPQYKDAPAMHLDGIVWWDEHHRKVILGHVSKFENRVAMLDGVATAVGEGGVLPAKSHNTVTKYAKEARGLFGVAVVNGVGMKAAPFTYTNRLVVGIKRWNAEQDAELVRVQSLGKAWGVAGAGYVQRYGDEWQDRVKETVNKQYCSIMELIDHMIAESEKLYKGTKYEKTFLMFHDALSTYFETEAQAYMKHRGYKDRMVRCYGDTNSDIKRYQNKLVGDTPELCPLDAHLFSDYKRSVAMHCSLTSVYDINDPQRFHFGTPDQVWSTLTRVWEVSPTPDRVREDIMAIRGRIGKIIEYRGAICPDVEFRGLRNGRRYIAMKNDNIILHQKPRQAARKNTLANYKLICHPNCIRAMEMLVNPAAVTAAEAAYAATVINLDDEAERNPPGDEIEDDAEPTEEDSDA